jgi:hypothetical protein
MKLKLLILTILFTSSMGVINAQSFGQTNNQSVELSLTPVTPQPQTPFKASLGVVDAGSQIYWFVGGVEVPTNQNQKELNLVAGRAGETENIEVQVISPLGTVSEAIRGFTPVYLDIIIEPQTLVPDFYQGRSLPSFGSQINATALISGVNTLTNNLVYRWEIGGKVLGGGALRGQYKMSFDLPSGQYPTLSLKVTDLQGNIVASRYISVPSVDPEIFFYEKSSLFGLKLKPIENRGTLFGETSSIEAVPYNLDSRVYNNPGLVEWKLGIETYKDLPGNPYEITLQSNENGGAAEIEFHVRNMDKLLQGARRSIDIRI